MRPAFLARMTLVAALFVAAGCSSNQGKIEATDWTSTATTAGGEEIAAGSRQLQFQKDGQLYFMNRDKLYKGNYTLGMGSAVTFTLEEDLDGRKIHPYKIVIEGDQLTMTNADGKAMTFQKGRKSAAQ